MDATSSVHKFSYLLFIANAYIIWDTYPCLTKTTIIITHIPIPTPIPIPTYRATEIITKQISHTARKKSYSNFPPNQSVSAPARPLSKGTCLILLMKFFLSASRDRTAHVLVRLHGCAGSPESLLFELLEYTKRTFFQWRISNTYRRYSQYLNTLTPYYACLNIWTTTKTLLFKYIDNFTIKNWKFSDKNSDIFHILFKT